MILGSKMKKMVDESRMIKTYRERVMYLEFVHDEWERLVKGEKLTRVIGSAKGYHRIDVKMVKIKDPYA